MSIQTLLNSLNKVKQTTRQNWIACCPAHDDNTPSLSIKEVDDGRILIHCFAGCSAAEILDALGLSFDDLYPEKNPAIAHKPLRKIIDAHTTLQLLQFESTLVLECARTLTRGDHLTDKDFDRLFQAAERIQRVCEAGGLA